MTNIFDLINNLSPDIINYEIKQFIPKKVFVFTNKENYILYHPLIKQDIKNYENYIRETIRRDNFFVFERIVRENYNKWTEIKKNICIKILFLKIMLILLLIIVLKMNQIIVEKL